MRDCCVRIDRSLVRSCCGRLRCGAHRAHARFVWWLAAMLLLCLANGPLHSRRIPRRPASAAVDPRDAGRSPARISSSPTSPSSTCRRRCGCRGIRARSALTHRFARTLNDARFRRAREQPVRPRQRRTDRPGVPVRRDARAAGRDLPNQRQDDSVLRAVRRDASERRGAVHARTSSPASKG